MYITARVLEHILCLLDSVNKSAEKGEEFKPEDANGCVEALASTAVWPPAATTDDGDEPICNKPKSCSSSLDADVDCGTVSDETAEDDILQAAVDVVTVLPALSHVLGNVFDIAVGCSRFVCVSTGRTVGATLATADVNMCCVALSPTAVCPHNTALIQCLSHYHFSNNI